MSAPQRPLFIPLYAEHFEAFERGDKTIEYRRWGARWNDSAIKPGRVAIIARGYSGPRLDAIVIKVERVRASSIKPRPALFPKSTILCAISLELRR